MPRRLIRDAHERGNEIPAVLDDLVANLQPEERTWLFCGGERRPF
jgi:hypothetical protein